MRSKAVSRKPRPKCCGVCDVPLVALPTDLSRGTGVCNRCAARRLDWAYTEIPAARRWLVDWTAKKRSHRRVPQS